MQSFAIIVAADFDGGIGRAGEIPWRFPEDFKWFKETTKGATCFMGRKTYDELAVIMAGKKELLPGRKCVVFTSKLIDDPRITTCVSIQDYVQYASEKNFFIGGAGVFDFGLDVADTVYLTNIPGTHGCDVFFPVAKLIANFTVVHQTVLSPQLRVMTHERRKR